MSEEDKSTTVRRRRASAPVNEPQRPPQTPEIDRIATSIIDGAKSLFNRVSAIGDHLQDDLDVVDDLGDGVARNATMIKAANGELLDLTAQIRGWGCAKCGIVMIVPLVVYLVGIVCRLT